MKTEDEKRILIAEKIGWKNCILIQAAKLETSKFNVWKPKSITGIAPWDDEFDGPRGLPDYFHDLNAAHIMEKNLTIEEWDSYCDVLGGSKQACAHATSDRRAEAFGTILGLW